MTDLTWRTERRKISELVPHQNNPRKMSEKQVADLTASIEKFNLVEIPAIDADNTIIAGHQRLKVMQLIGRGEEEVEVRIPSRPLTLEERDEYLIRSNKNVGDWDFNLLANFDEALLLGSGFSKIELSKGFGLNPSAEDDGFDEAPPAKPVSVAGAIYQLGQHRLMCGDATSAADIEKLMDGKLADIVFTDSPYGVSYVGKTKDALTIENDAMDEAGTEKLWAAAYKNLRDNLRVGGAIYATVPAGPLHLIFAKVMKDFGDLRQILVWQKDAFVLGRSDYHYRHEPILYGWKEGAPHTFYGDRKQDTVWEIPRPKRSTEHPTMKPIALMERALVNSSLSGEIVLDPFLGSGSTLIAAQQCGRVCYGMEIDPAYCDVVRKRAGKFGITGDVL